MLHAWFVPAINVTTPAKAKGTVIFVHGNGGNITASWPFVNWLPGNGYNVFTFDYRGYGNSQGTPSPQGLFEDTQAAIAYIRQKADIDPDKLFVISQSLGGNNTIAAIGSTSPSHTPLGYENMKQGIRAIVIDSTFYFYTSIANAKIPGAGLLMNDDYSAAHHVAALAPIPLLFIHGTSDRIVPYEQGKRLFEIAPDPKQFITIPGGQHITALSSFYKDTYRNEILVFFENALQSE